MYGGRDIEVAEDQEPRDRESEWETLYYKVGNRA